jgi:sugar phosphate isomerase/epimerase
VSTPPVVARTQPEGPAQGAKLCLKARPTPGQLADRLRAVDGTWPDGLELYLAATDLANSSIIDEIVARIQAAAVPPDFAYLIEGPVDSLDGADFDVTRDSPDDLQVVERLAHLAQRIGARAVNIHVIAPSADLSRLTLGCRAALLERAVPFLRRFVELTQSAGAVPTVENMPPVLRMRRAGFSFTPIGMASADLLWCVEQVRGLKILPDTSHAGLYLNARRLAPDPDYAWSAPLAEYLQQLPSEAPDLLGYIESMAEHVENAQVSNAAGILGEGLPYGQGDFDLDPVIRWFGMHTRHVVPETIESNNDDAITMRDALRRMRRALA